MKLIRIKEFIKTDIITVELGKISKKIEIFILSPFILENSE